MCIYAWVIIPMINVAAMSCHFPLRRRKHVGLGGFAQGCPPVMSGNHRFWEGDVEKIMLKCDAATFLNNIGSLLSLTQTKANAQMAANC